MNIEDSILEILDTAKALTEAQKQEMATSILGIQGIKILSYFVACPHPSGWEQLSPATEFSIAKKAYAGVNLDLHQYPYILAKCSLDITQD